MIKPKRFTVILVVTNSCNLHCKYCYEHMKDSSGMTLQMALDIADTELSAHPDERVVFDIFGGEPFLQWEMVRDFCETIWHRYSGRDIRMACITNGTLVDEDAADWLRENSHRFFCHISLDGTPEMHRDNRGEIFPEDTAVLFGNIWPNATAKMTVSKSTIGKLYEGVIYINNLGLNVAFSLARGLEWDVNDLTVYKRELSRLVEYYSSKERLRTVDLFETSLAPVLLPRMQERYCGAGHSICAYAPDGKKYPCQMFMPVSLAQNRWEEIMDIDLRADRLFYHDEDCRNCDIQNLCEKCPGLNFKERRNVGLRDKRLCDFLRAECNAVARYKIDVLTKKPFNLMTKDDYIELKAASKLLKAEIG